MNALITQIRDLFQSMTPGARITAGSLLLVAAVSIAYLFQHSTSGADAYLFGGEPLSQSQITRMTAAMAEAGISDWEIEANRIRVPRSQQDASVAAIASAGALPADFSSYMDEALAKASPFEPRQQWELRTKAARENQLSHLISLMPWVESAHVMLDVEERRGFNRKNLASASVFVTPRQGESVDRGRARNVQQFVAGTMASLNVENVQVTSGGSDVYADGEVVFDDPYLQAREDLQDAYRDQLRQLLAYIPGVRVEVSANLDNMKTREVTETTPGEPKVVRSVSEREEEQTSTSDGGGRPGLEANGPGRRGLDENLARENRSSVTRDSTNEESTVGFTQSVDEYQGFRPKELYASIAIPRDYAIETWKKRQQHTADEGMPELTETELENIESDLEIQVERSVRNILPRLSLGEDDYRQVEVVFYDALKHEPPPEPTFTENAIAWAGQYWGTLSMLGLAVLSLLMLRSVIRPDSREPTSEEATTVKLDLGAEDEPAADAEPEEPPARPKLKLKKATSLKEDLSEMVREDPDTAASVLRSWINNAG